ncbi:MAG: hypothetical protein KDC66_21155 [Phaeodactylibacter sp.]|nr:hypothetical protein [Phaeodactylibacter sp.]
MAAPVLYEVLLKLEKAELRRLAKFVRSPFFTHRQEMGRMFSCLSVCLYRGRALPDKALLFRKSFPGRDYDDLLLRATMSDLRELVEEFLAWQKMRSGDLRYWLALAAEYRERGLGKFFNQAMKKVEKGLGGQPFRNADYLAQLLDYQLERAQFETRTVRTGELPLQAIADSIDALFLAQKLRHACTQLSHQAVFKTEYDFGLLPKVLGEVEAGGFLRIPAIALYYYCYRFLTEQDSLGFFRQFRQELRENGSHFPDSELKNLYLLAINYCIRKLNEGHGPFVLEGWELYQEGLAQGFLLEHGRLSGFTFNNVAAFGIKLGVFEAVEAFIEQYRDKLEPVQQESFVHFNLARLEYTRGNYTAALHLMQTADFKDLVNNLIAKTMLLKIYFELDEFDLLDSHLESFRRFIHRREVSDYHRENYTNIIALVKKLMALPPGDSAARAALQAEAENKSVLTEREWLLEMARR